MDTPDWMLDETAHAGPEHLDPGYVEGYERKSGVDLVDDVEVLRRHGLHGQSMVVDLAAGTGRFTLAVAPVCAAVAAVDVSPAMTQYLAAEVEKRGLPNVSITTGGYLSFEYPEETADFIYSRNALHQVPDFFKVVALQRMATWLRPGGILRIRDLIFDFEPTETGEQLAEWMAGAVDDPRDGWTPAELAEHVRTEYSTFRWLFEAMLQRTGFEILEVEYRRHAYGDYTCRRAGINA